jgi:hypothetical protein
MKQNYKAAQAFLFAALIHAVRAMSAEQKKKMFLHCSKKDSTLRAGRRRLRTSLWRHSFGLSPASAGFSFCRRPERNQPPFRAAELDSCWRANTPCRGRGGRLGGGRLCQPGNVGDREAAKVGTTENLLDLDRWVHDEEICARDREQNADVTTVVAN